MCCENGTKFGGLISLFSSFSLLADGVLEVLERLRGRGRVLPGLDAPAQGHAVEPAREQVGLGVLGPAVIPWV